MVEEILKRDKKRRKRIEAAGIDYECPEIVRTYELHLFSVLLCDAANTASLLLVRVRKLFLCFG